MKCRHVRDLASQYLSSELPTEKVAAIEAHLTKCDACRAETAATERALRALERPKPLFKPPDVLEAVKMQVARPGRRFKPARIGWAFAGAATLALAAWLAVSIHPARHAPPVNRVVTESRMPKEIAKKLAVNQPLKPIPAIAKESTGNAPDTHASRPIRKPHGPERHPSFSPKPEPVRVAPEPTIEYLVVYTPELSEPTAAAPAETEAASDVEDTNLPDTAYYSIRMTDNSSGEIATLSVRTELEPGAEPNIIMDYAVTNKGADRDGSERSFFDESMPLRNNHAVHPTS